MEHVSAASLPAGCRYPFTKPREDSSLLQHAVKHEPRWPGQLADSLSLTPLCWWMQLIKTPGSQLGVQNFFTSHFSII